jgi:rod shape determining protein RodA
MHFSIINSQPPILLMNSNNNLFSRLHLDLALVGPVVIVCVIGVILLYSASDGSIDMVLKQLMRMSIGMMLMLGIAQVSPRVLFKLSPFIYLFGISLLVAVHFSGDSSGGASRWLDIGLVRFQPSEVMKIALPLMLAAIVSNRPLPPSTKSIFLCCFLLAVPVFMIYDQPDLGTALLVAFSGLIVLFLAGISWRFIRYFFLFSLCAAPLVWFLIHSYQRERILTLFNPERDPLGAGYHIIQSKIAIGSGGLYGKGWLNGTQSHLEFLPERATDFIAVYCEEFGLMGVLMLLSAYFLVIFRGIHIARKAQNSFGRILSASFVITFVIYILVNVMMVIGIVPVVGVPLPLMSYGGTSMVTMMASFGVLMSIHTHRNFYSRD